MTERWVGPGNEAIITTQNIYYPCREGGGGEVGREEGREEGMDLGERDGEGGMEGRDGGGTGGGRYAAKRKVKEEDN